MSVPRGHKMNLMQRDRRFKSPSPRIKVPRDFPAIGGLKSQRESDIILMSTPHSPIVKKRLLPPTILYPSTTKNEGNRAKNMLSDPRFNNPPSETREHKFFSKVATSANKQKQPSARVKVAKVPSNQGLMICSSHQSLVTVDSDNNKDI